MRRRFVPEGSAELHGQTLHNRRQQPGESVTNYAIEIQRLASLTYPDVDPDTLDSIIRQIFLAGILEHLWFFVFFRFLLTFPMAEMLARQAEAQEQILQARRSAQMQQIVSQVLPALPTSELRAPTPTLNALRFADPYEDDRKRQFSSRDNNNDRQRQNQRQSRTQWQQPRRDAKFCNFCECPGHYQANCNLLQKARSFLHKSPAQSQSYRPPRSPSRFYQPQRTNPHHPSPFRSSRGRFGRSHGRQNFQHQVNSIQDQDDFFFDDSYDVVHEQLAPSSR